MRKLLGQNHKDLCCNSSSPATPGKCECLKVTAVTWRLCCWVQELQKSERPRAGLIRIVIRYARDSSIQVCSRGSYPATALWQAYPQCSALSCSESGLQCPLAKGQSQGTQLVCGRDVLHTWNHFALEPDFLMHALLCFSKGKELRSQENRCHQGLVFLSKFQDGRASVPRPSQFDKSHPHCFSHNGLSPSFVTSTAF